MPIAVEISKNPRTPKVIPSANFVVKELEPLFDITVVSNGWLLLLSSSPFPSRITGKVNRQLAILGWLTAVGSR
jgi:hypothetical protein